MKKTGILLLLLSLLITASPAHATIINVGTFSGSFDHSSFGHVNYLNFELGLDNPTPLYYDDQFGVLLKIDPTGTSNDLTAMLERRFIPLATDGDTVPAERASMWRTKMLYFSLGLDCEQDIYFESFRTALPDLSMYDIESLYMYNSIFQNGTDTGFKLQLYAEAEPVPAPVPEPSTMLLFLAGLAATVCFLRLDKSRTFKAFW